jgi:hypothetical protein
MLVHIKEYKGFEIEIHTDRDALSPRSEMDNLGIMVCWHDRHNLGDCHTVDQKDSWQATKKAIESEFNVGVMLPVYLYDHSVLAIQTKPFSCPWDSGQVGFIFITEDALRSEYDLADDMPISAEILELALRRLEGEVEIYNQYLQGDVFGYVIRKDGNEIDSLWNMYGLEYAIDEAKQWIDTESNINAASRYSVKIPLETLIGNIANHVQCITALDYKNKAYRGSPIPDMPLVDVVADRMANGHYLYTVNGVNVGNVHGAVQGFATICAAYLADYLEYAETTVEAKDPNSCEAIECKKLLATVGKE